MRIFRDRSGGFAVTTRHERDLRTRLKVGTIAFNEFQAWLQTREARRALHDAQVMKWNEDIDSCRRCIAHWEDAEAKEVERINVIRALRAEYAEWQADSNGLPGPDELGEYELNSPLGPIRVHPEDERLTAHA